ncbi:nitrite reductase large subunit NirB [Gorillibacterium sp. sgz500922]|uniref:nitrite reductase large subunit NirB n=1 Tax=Gorillibacterium sp. sgz500922 TaxID=3446694 RepID=UPI003F674CC9
MKDNTKPKLLMIGNGMAGVGMMEQLLKLAPTVYDITIIGQEPYPNYNRIQLSYVLEGSKSIEEIVTNPYEWYRENGIALHTGTRVEAVDPAARTVRTDSGLTLGYDKLVFATGSLPFMLPIPGADKEGVVGFRDIADCEKMLAAAATHKKAAVIGGGLLGLEAAKGLSKLGMDVTVVHLVQDLMERQLDSVAAGMLQAELTEQGLNFACGKQTTEIVGDGRVEGLRFSDGTELAADFVVMAVGIKPNTALAKASGIAVNRGIVVDDLLRTSAPDVYAVGECNEHRGVCYGLVAPLFEQGAVLAKHLAGIETEPYTGSTVSTKLKISGVDVFSAGEFMDGPGLTAIKQQDDWKRTYKKVLLRGNQIVGAVLFGDVSDSIKLQKWIRTGAEMTDDIYGQLVGQAVQADSGVAEMADDEIVCGCKGVTKGMIVGAIREHGLKTADEVKQVTGASSSCGGCRPVVEQILAYVLGDEYDQSAVKTGICGCTDLSRDEIVAAIEEKGLTTSREVMNVLGWREPEGCSKCRPALNYYLGMLHPVEHEEERASRFVNERYHANIQKDGTYTVVPRMYGGVTTAEDLKRIADVAVKYQVKMVKMTGGQRIDLIGVKKEDLPAVWEELDMPSGYAYAKALRTVKTCVGNRFCRFGTQDSIGMGVALEKKFERLDMPAKLKMAVNGCPRNCAESCTKDVGIVGNDGGWELYVGGNGGIKARLADLLCKVKTDEELVEMTGAFIQLYRETAKYLERTSDWIERMGLDWVQKNVVEDAENRKRLSDRIELALSRTAEPWSKVTASSQLKEAMYLPGQAEKSAVPVRIGAVEEFLPRIGRSIEAEGQAVAVFRLADGSFRAVEDRNATNGGPLAEGIVSGDSLYDPLYDTKINLTTGETSIPGGRVRTYPVNVEEGQVWLLLEAAGQPA